MSLSLSAHSTRRTLVQCRTFHCTANRARNQVHGPSIGPSARMHFYTQVNKAITYSCIGTGVGVFCAWNYANQGIIYSTLMTLQRRTGGWARKLGLELPSPQRVRRVLDTYFLLKSSDSKNYAAWIGSAFSHQAFYHALFNLYTWSSIGPLLFAVPPVHMVALIFGSAMASSAAWLAMENRRPRQERRFRSACGSSGIVSGVLSTAALFYPFTRVSLFLVIPMPMYVAVGGFFLLDAYFSQKDVASPIAHSAHLGGATFGVAYYLLFLRRYGGILGR